MALYSLLQVLADVMERILRQKSLFPRGGNGRRIGAGPLCADPVGREQGSVLQHLAEEAPGRLQITCGGTQKTDRRAVLVDRPLQVTPLAANLYSQLEATGPTTMPSQ